MYRRIGEFFQLGSLASESAVVSDRLLYRIQQILTANRFGQELKGSFFHRPHRHRNIAVAGHEDDWNVDVRGTQGALKIKAIQSRHPHVEDKAGRNIRALRKPKALCGSEGLDAKANRFDHAADAIADQGVIIDYEDNRVRFLHAAASPPLGRVN